MALHFLFEVFRENASANGRCTECGMEDGGFRLEVELQVELF